MDKLIQGFEQFRKVTYPSKQRLFKKLATAQAPHTLVITCADSRVVPEYFTSSDPGQLFVVRNVGNIVPPYAQFVGGVSAAIEYAVVVLGVKDIVVCGHSDCGAMKATLKPGSTDSMPAVTAWLRHAEVARHVYEQNYQVDDEKAGLRALTEENVISQLDHLRTHPSVAARLAAGKIGIHGWVYDIETADIRVFDGEARRFVTLQIGADDKLIESDVVPAANGGTAAASSAGYLRAVAYAGGDL
ncbi:MAG: carbonate dehydratase [Xanthomonadaceae bacterium]|nr:carbonate dehydratase [Xanthomonadaceae bacterium]